MFTFTFTLTLLVGQCVGGSCPVGGQLQYVAPPPAIVYAAQEPTGPAGPTARPVPAVRSIPPPPAVPAVPTARYPVLAPHVWYPYTAAASPCAGGSCSGRPSGWAFPFPWRRR
ncbi:MAG: hypothetical protein IRY99_03450 [Isosphaeraceae bacterium]|nr:hypothetical protein [Isosphaeraceae bacterium]